MRTGDNTHRTGVTRGRTVREVTPVAFRGQVLPVHAQVHDPGEQSRGPTGAPDGPGGPGGPVDEIVAVHGLGCSHRYLEPLARLLVAHAGRTTGRRVRVVLPDLPGFGPTPAPEPGSTPDDDAGSSGSLAVADHVAVLAAWLGTRPRPPALLVGHSLGAQIVAALPPFGPQGERAPAVLVGPTGDPAGLSVARYARRMARAAVWERPSVVWALGPDYARCGARRYLDTLRLSFRDPVPEHLLRYDAPAVVVRGQHDSIAPEGWCRQVAALLPQGRYVEVPAVGHTLTWSAPRALAAVVIDQLRRAAPVPGEGPIPVPRGA